MTVRCAVLVAAALLLAAGAGSAEPSTRSRRRVTPTRLRPITLDTLFFECSVQAWSVCLDAVQTLQNSSHPLSLSTAHCISSNNPELSPSLPSTTSLLSPTPLFTDPPPNTTAGPKLATYANADSLGFSSEEQATPAPVERQDGCPLSQDEKAYTRQNVYCSQVFKIDKKLRGLAYIITFLRDWNCIRKYVSNGYLSPTQIIDSIKMWHQKLINDHRCCENSGNRTFSRSLNYIWGGRVDVMAGEELRCPLQLPSQGWSLWDRFLAQVGWLVHMVDLMRSLGRGKRCMRGCVSAGQVLCTNLFPHLPSFIQ